MCVDWLSALTATYRGLSHRIRSLSITCQHLLWRLQDLVILRIRKNLWLPCAHLTIIADTHNVMCVLIADHREGVDWVLVPIGSQATLLDGLWSVSSVEDGIDRILFGSDIPHQQISCHRRSYDDVRIVRVENCLSNLVLTVECEFWPSLHAQTEDIDLAIWRIQVPFTTLAVAC